MDGWMGALYTCYNPTTVTAGCVLLTIAEEERDECDMWLRLPSMFPP